MNSLRVFSLCKKKILSNEIKNCVKLWIKDSRFIGSAQQGRMKRKLSKEFRCYKLTYACKHEGGKKFKSREKGERKTSY